MPDFSVRKMNVLSERQRTEAANILVEAFREFSPSAYPTLDEALMQVDEALEAGKVFIAALDPDEHVSGWIGGYLFYSEVWELHPLAVRPDAQKRGIGRALIAALEDAAREAGARTMYVGSDDEPGWTNLAGLDLYDDIPGAIRDIQSDGRHPFAFYQRCGYTVIGLVPDANGPGKPDILMGKRLLP